MDSQLLFNPDNHENRETFFADVVLPLPIPKRYTYRVPFEFNELIKKGIRVIVQFGRTKILTGIVGNVHTHPPLKYEAKPILDVLDNEPTINHHQMELFEWMAGYYMCTPGEVYNAALPSGLKLHSESKVQLHPDFQINTSNYDFSPNETLLIDYLSTRESISYSEIHKLLGVKNIYRLLKSLVAENILLVYEGIHEKYKPKTEVKVRLSDSFLVTEEKLKFLLDTLSAFPKQEDIVLKYLQEVPVFNDPLTNIEGLSKSVFSKPDFSTSSLQTLIKKGVFEEFKKKIPRFQSPEQLPEIALSSLQKRTFEEILAAFEKKSVALLHGITGSGKTEIYIELIRNALDNGSQVLLLLPEIALTTQIVGRFQKVFGDHIGVYHSRFSDNERVEVWKGVQSGELGFVVGVRSSLFLPFQRLGLIIVDEEHEPSYKQFDPAPRYHARDVAIMMGKIHGARVLLGSATPSLESYFNCLQEKYALITLESRYGEAVLPEYSVVDVKEEQRKKRLKGQFSNALLEHIEKTIQDGQQIIIFQNRRGYSYFVRCEICDYIPKCNNCSVSLTYHQYKKELRCHYCGYREPLPTSCTACGSAKIKTIGFGTEKLEEDLNLLLPHVEIGRMDMDTMRTKSSYDSLLKDFETGKINILVGTQMLSKGLDFDNVALVAIIDLDRQLHFPDFRSFERTFQLSVQVGGRAGRRTKRGTVIIQTTNAEQEIVSFITSSNYQGFYKRELEEREKYHYPPFTRLIKITVKDKDKQQCFLTANRVTTIITKLLGRDKVLGPEEPVIGKIRNNYLMETIVKLERGKYDLMDLKRKVRDLTDEIVQTAPYKSSSVIFNVDPM